jgi:phenylacetate-CoA ligase
MKIYNRIYETLSHEDREQLKLERLQSTINRAYKNVEFYNSEMKAREIAPRDINSVSDLGKLGFTTREDLSYNYPYGLFSVPLRDIVRINSISGMSGKPVVMGYTRNDLGVWTELLSRLYVASGVDADDIVQICFIYGLANWGRAMKTAAENIEASVIPMSALNPEKQIMIMSDYKTSCLVSTPSYALHLAMLISEMGIAPKKLSLKRGILISETLSEDARKKIESGLKIKVSTAYGIPEAIGPGIAYECPKGKLHIAEDHFIVEVIDPKTGEVKTPGEKGELILTTITTKAFPLIRFRTGDISSIVTGKKCACGRTLPTMEMPDERTDYMLSIRGVKVYPSQIERIITDILGETPPYVITIYKVRELDEVDILIEEVESLFSDEIKVLEEIISRIKGDLLEVLGIRANVKLVEHFTMEELKKGGKKVIYK